jgi:hypothetical protein
MSMGQWSMRRCRRRSGSLWGGVDHPVFGRMVMFGLGGLFVEVLKDVSFRVAPLRRVDALEMIAETKAASLLQGARGTHPLDVEAIVHRLLAVSKIMRANRLIVQLGRRTNGSPGVVLGPSLTDIGVRPGGACARPRESAQGEWPRSGDE